MPHPHGPVGQAYYWSPRTAEANRDRRRLVPETRPQQHADWFSSCVRRLAASELFGVANSRGFVGYESMQPFGLALRAGRKTFCTTCALIGRGFGRRRLDAMA